MTVGSLFTGIGGMDLGLERAGFSVLWQCEINRYCRHVLKTHWPLIPQFNDIVTLDWATVPHVRVLCGGFPCQDISHAGKGAGLHGSRSQLWYEFLRSITILSPDYVLIENVAALRGRGLDSILREIAAIGYDAEWHCIPASAVGAPHRRDRVWVIAYHHRLGVEGCLVKAIPQFRAFSWFKDVRGVEDFFTLPTIPQPLIRGAGDGVPHWVDRLKSLGNSVVPQIVECIGTSLMQHIQHE